MSPMKHDGLTSDYIAQDGSSTSTAGAVTPAPLASNSSSTRLDNQPGTARILCPVAGCPEASPLSSKNFKSFASIKNHLNAHCTGYLTGAVPADFLRYYRYSQCPVCDKVIHFSRNGTCPRCRPTSRIQAQINAIRSRSNVPRNNSTANNQHPELEVLPSLSDIHDKFVPTIKNVPFKLRRLWSQCLAKSLAQAVWSNSIESWTELQMLPKCTLCRPARGGRSHKSQKLAWTQARLQRWLAGECSGLWHDIPRFKWPKP